MFQILNPTRSVKLCIVLGICIILTQMFDVLFFTFVFESFTMNSLYLPTLYH